MSEPFSKPQHWLDRWKVMKPHWDWIDQQYSDFPFHVVLSFERYEQLYVDGTLDAYDVFQPHEDFVVGIFRHCMETATICFRDSGEAILFKLTWGGNA